MEDNKPATTGAGSRLAKKRSRPPKTPNQNPQDEPERLLEISIGRQLRAMRRERGRTMADLSHASGLSISMLSKIENGMISPSLSSLQRLGTALSVPLSTFFSSFDDRGGASPDPAGSAPALPPGTDD